MFRSAFKQHRCIVVASGFFEWKREEVNGKIAKKPFYIYQKDNQPMILAGIWDRCERKKGPQIGFTILTTNANDLLSKYHNRMPVILEHPKIDLWLRTTTNASEILEFFKPLPSKNLTIKEVSQIVNSPKNDTPECLV
jgi:putative SOS response-associated peptidase YedK